jgi:hypothetical protein
MKETICHNKEKNKGNTKYLNPTLWKTEMKHDEKQPDSGTTVSSLVCA